MINLCIALFLLSFSVQSAEPTDREPVARGDTTIVDMEADRRHTSDGGLSSIRRHEVTAFTNDLLDGYQMWYKVSNIAEMFGKVCMVLGPICAGVSPALSRPILATIGMGLGLVGVGLAEFSNWSARESEERGLAANLMLVQEGQRPVAILRNGSRANLSGPEPVRLTRAASRDGQ